MKTQNILKAYQTVVESQISSSIPDEDDETSTREILSKISTGLRDILDSIDRHLSSSGNKARLRSGVKTLKIPDEYEGSSWLPSLK